MYYSVIGMAKGSSLEDLVFVGLVGICDPPRPHVKEAIHMLQTSGVRVNMVTGDSHETALAIGKTTIKFLFILVMNLLSFTFLFSSTAAAVGLDTVHHQSLSGDQIDQMSEQQLEQIIKSVSVFYRVTPKHKLCIVKVCHHFVSNKHLMY